jgi:exodeoxyribonuclease-1
MYAPDRGCIAAVWPLVPHPTNKNELIVWDLSADPGELFGLNAAQIRERLFTRTEDLPEGVSRLPLKTIHVNKSPVVISSLETLSPSQAERWGMDMAQVNARAQECAARAGTMAGIWPDVFMRPESGQPADVDEDLYSGFLGATDRQRLDRLRGLSLGDGAWARASFDDRRLDELVFRYRARNHTAALSDGERARWLQHCAARLHEGAGGVTPLPAYFERLDELAEAADERGQAILGALYDYAEGIAPPHV